MGRIWHQGAGAGVAPVPHVRQDGTSQHGDVFGHGAPQGGGGARFCGGELVFVLKQGGIPGEKEPVPGSGKGHYGQQHPHGASAQQAGKDGSGGKFGSGFLDGLFVIVHIEQHRFFLRYGRFFCLGCIRRGLGRIFQEQDEDDGVRHADEAEQGERHAPSRP